MDKYKIISRIENFAPLDTQEVWDCSGWLVETDKVDIKRVMLCLTITKDIINQALKNHCDMIISHHPLFHIPMDWRNIDIYCAHTNMDLADGGTTDILVKNLGFPISSFSGFVRYVDYKISLRELLNRLRRISPNLRYVNNSGLTEFCRLAFCAGSGSEFIYTAYQNGADCFITGDLKFHTAIDSPVPVFDIGHFESEIGILGVFQALLGNDIDILNAQEKSPFNYS